MKLGIIWGTSPEAGARDKQKRSKEELSIMVGTILIIVCVVGVCAYIAGAVNEESKKRGDNRVEHGKTFFGSRYRTVHGPCYRCRGTGKVRGRDCPKCGGTGEYRRTTWFE